MGHMSQNYISFFSIFSFCLVVIGSSVVNGQLRCPQQASDDPCQCSVDSASASGQGNLSLICIFERTTQSTIDRLFANVRTTNGLTSPGQILPVHHFSIVSTNLNKFDLTPLLHCQFETIYITKNRHLVTIPPPSSEGRFEVTTLFLEGSLLSDEGIGNFLNHIEPKTSLTSLWLGGNRIQGSRPDFLPGLSSFTQLRLLNLDFNQIEQIGGGQFRQNGALVKLDLTSNNISQIGDNAFLIDGDGSAADLGQVNILLDRNQLSDDAIHSNHGLASRSNVDKFVSLKGNQFEFISAEKFESSLRPGGSISRLELTSNLFVCDERMTWVRQRKEDFETRVIGVNCTNDVGKTIFDTDLVSSSIIKSPSHFTIFFLFVTVIVSLK